MKGIQGVCGAAHRCTDTPAATADTQMLAGLLAAHAADPQSPSQTLPHPSGTYLPSEKIRLRLDPLAYRSAMQGAIMPEELEPATAKDYDEIEAVIERATRTHGWAPIIPQYKRSMRWAWRQWEFTITERLWKVVITRMLIPTVLLVATHLFDPSLTWWYIPKDHRLAKPFAAIASSWNYILTLATFVVTFFVGVRHHRPKRGPCHMADR